jgi:acetolactate synthase-1/2/3 large subunit
MRGIRVVEKGDVASALEQARTVDGPVLIEFRVAEEENVYPMVPAGGSISAMLRRPLEGKEVL